MASALKNVKLKKGSIVTEEERRDLTQRQVFLDGYPARIQGIKNQYATVFRLDAIHLSVDFAWTTAKRVTEAGGFFKSY